MYKKSKLLTSLIISSVIFTSIISFPINKALASSETTRIFGTDRYKTSMAILDCGWESSKNLVLASGENYPDALCSVPLAKQLDAPVLLMSRNGVTDELTNKIKQLKVENIFIIGGDGSISKIAEAILKEKTNVPIKRLFGNTRYETSVAVANYMYSNFNMSREVVVSSGLGFADALSIAPIAARSNMAILLTDKNTFTSNVKSFLDEKEIAKSYIIGGSGVISENSIKNYPSPERVWGEDRYTTNINVINRFKSNSSDFYIASGDNFPDALSGAALAAKDSSFIVLTSKSPSKATINLVSNMASNSSDINNMVILGGIGVISDKVVEKLTTRELDFTGNMINFNNVSFHKGYIYYNNSTDNSYHKLSSDGTIDKKLTEAFAVNLYITESNIYYAKLFGSNNGIFKANIDGSNKINLSTDIPLTMQVYGDWIYYTKSDGQGGGELWRMKTNGATKEKITLNIKNPYYVDHGYVFCIKDGYIYINILEKQNGIYASKFVMTSLDGKTVKLITNASMPRFQPVDNWVYYANANGIYKIKNDGTQNTLISQIKSPNYSVYSINIFNNKIYYNIINYKDEGVPYIGVYQMNLDGTNKVKLTDQPSQYLYVVPGWVYFQTGNGLSKIAVENMN